MLIYHSKLCLKLDQFGIGVPLKNSRDTKSFETIKNEFTQYVFETPLEDFPHLAMADLSAVHDPAYIQGLFSSTDFLCQALTKTYELDQYGLESDLKNQEQLLEILLLHCRGAYLAMKKAFLEPQKFCYLLGGGMHHAMSFGGRGFCLLNDGVIGLQKLQAEFQLKNIWVVDVDAHKGDGTAELARSRGWLRTLSLHMGTSWPFGQVSETKDSPWLIPSDIDIAFGFNEEQTYLPRLQAGLQSMLEKFGAPDLVWVVAGADVFEHDELLSAKGINLTKEQVLERDRIIYRFFKQLDVPQAWCLAGGYGERTWEIPTQFLREVLIHHPR